MIYIYIYIIVLSVYLHMLAYRCINLCCRCGSVLCMCIIRPFWYIRTSVFLTPLVPCALFRPSNTSSPQARASACAQSHSKAATNRRVTARAQSEARAHRRPQKHVNFTSSVKTLKPLFSSPDITSPRATTSPFTGSRLRVYACS